MLKQSNKSIFFAIAQISCPNPQEVKTAHICDYAYSRPLSSHLITFRFWAEILKDLKVVKDIRAAVFVPGSYGITFIRYCDESHNYLKYWREKFLFIHFLLCCRVRIREFLLSLIAGSYMVLQKQP